MIRAACPLLFVVRRTAKAQNAQGLFVANTAINASFASSEALSERAESIGPSAVCHRCVAALRNIWRVWIACRNATWSAAALYRGGRICAGPAYGRCVLQGTGAQTLDLSQAGLGR